MTKARRMHGVNIRLKETGFDNVSAMLPPLPEGCALAHRCFILGHPGGVSRAGTKCAKKVFSPWVPTITGPFPNGQANVGS